MLRFTRLSIIKNLFSHLVSYPTSKSLSYLWSLGSLAGLLYSLQIISGLLLVAHYSPSVDYAFYSVEHIMRDINSGWLLRYTHAVVASFIFFTIYLHIVKALWNEVYSEFNYSVWFSGLLLFFLTMAAAFLGYVLPWGQMSFWGATVITNLFSAVPIIGKTITLWLWGGFSIGNPTLNRFFMLHFLIPFLAVGLILVHLVLLHVRGSTSPTKNIFFDTITFYPYFSIKDGFSLFFALILIFFFIFFAPNELNHPDNYVPANSLVTPSHIVPEWYFLTFYAVLRSIDSKFFGVLFMFLAIIIFFLINLYDFGFNPNKEKYLFITSKHFNFSMLLMTLKQIFFWIFCFTFISLSWLGAQEVKDIFVFYGSLACLFYFSYIICLPFIFENLYFLCYYVKIVERISLLEKRFSSFINDFTPFFSRAYSKWKRKTYSNTLPTYYYYSASFFVFNKNIDEYLYQYTVDNLNLLSSVLPFSDTNVLQFTIYILITLVCALLIVAFATLHERKILALVQRRKGPEKLGYWGLIQPLSDGLKLFLKRIIIPSKATPLLFWLSVTFAISINLLNWYVIPYDMTTPYFDMKFSVLVFFSLSSLTTFIIILSGWASNSKYAMIGSIRSVAQFISYEAIFTISILCVYLHSGSLNFKQIVLAQVHHSFIWPLLPIAIIFYISILAELNRTPFDLSEAESELVAGYAVEFSAVLFSILMIIEYSSMLLFSATFCIFFLGGWNSFLFLGYLLPASTIFGLKTILVYSSIVLVRAILPRYRYDQLMFLCWFKLLPLCFSFLIFYIGLMLFFGYMPLIKGSSFYDKFAFYLHDFSLKEYAPLFSFDEINKVIETKINLTYVSNSLTGSESKQFLYILLLPYLKINNILLQKKLYCLFIQIFTYLKNNFFKKIFSTSILFFTTPSSFGESMFSFSYYYWISDNWLFFFSFSILLIGIFGLLINRNNFLITLLNMEFILLGVGLAFISFSVYWFGDLKGQINALIVLTIAAAESAIGLGLFVKLYKNNLHTKLFSDLIENEENMSVSTFSSKIQKKFIIFILLPAENAYIELFIAFLVTFFTILFLFFAVSRLNSNSHFFKLSLSAYECGFQSYGDARAPFDVAFYVIALLFLLLDIELMFLFPWISSAVFLNFFGRLSMFIFIWLLIIGFIFEYSMGAFFWLDMKILPHNAYIKKYVKTT